VSVSIDGLETQADFVRLIERELFGKAGSIPVTGVRGLADQLAPLAGFATVASAATLTLPDQGSLIEVTGTTNITSVTASAPGRVVVLTFTDALTFTEGSNLILAGNFVTAANNTITLICDGTDWLEMARSVN
jgi:hypothetical protein